MTKALTTSRLADNRFPTLFRSSLFDDLFNGLEDFESVFFQKGGTPCDIVAIKNDQGDIVANEFSYALAGYEKGDVNVEIDDDRLTITVDKSEKEEDVDEKRSYIHKGLTRKTQKWSYVLNSKVDSQNVSANMENGVLKVIVPILPQKEIKKIEVK